MPRSPGARFSVLACAYALSTYGNYLNLVALSLLTYQVTGSGLGTGLVMALRLGAGALAGLAAGGLVTRFDRRRLMICTDLVQALAMTALVWSTDVVVLGCVVVVLGAGNSVFTVALRTSVPEMVGQDARVRANGLLVTARSVGMVLGFGSAGVVIGTGAFGVAFAINAASFAVSALALSLIRLRTNGLPVEKSEGARASLRGVAVVLLLMVGLRGIDALASSSHNVALPVFANALEPGSAAAFMSRFWVAWAVGVLLAHQLVSRLSGRPGQRTFAVATCVMSVSFALAFTGLPAPLLMAVALVAGIADGTTEIAYTSRLQEVPEHERGRLFGLSATAETSGFAVGMVVSGAALDVLPAVAVVCLLHGLALCSAVAFLLLTHLGGKRNGGRTSAGPLPGAGAGALRG